MVRVGITGGIGSGKTIVASVFERIGVPVFYADAEAAHITNSHPDLIRSLKENFGADIIGSDGTPDRKKLREVIFHDEGKRKAINSLIHPLVKQRFESWCSEHQHFPIVMKEAAILFESGSDKGLNKVIVVAAPEDLRIQRVMKRDGVDEGHVRAVMKNQMPESEKTCLADFVIHNDEEQLLVPQVLRVHSILKALSLKPDAV